MGQRQVDGIDAYDFPDDLVGHPLLAWMGDDYVQFVAVELLRRFRQQDAGTEMVAIKCEERPKLLTSVNEHGDVRGVVAEFNLQLLFLVSSGQHWRLRGDGRFTAVGVDQVGGASIAVEFEVRSAEEVAKHRASFVGRAESSKPDWAWRWTWMPFIDGARRASQSLSPTYTSLPRH